MKRTVAYSIYLPHSRLFSNFEPKAIFRTQTISNSIHSELNPFRTHTIANSHHFELTPFRTQIITNSNYFELKILELKPFRTQKPFITRTLFCNQKKLIFQKTPDDSLDRIPRRGLDGPLPGETNEAE